MRSVALILVSIAASGGSALGQVEPRARVASVDSRSEAPEEIIVRGRRLAELKTEMQTLQKRAYDRFNEINIDDDFDVRCRDEGRTGTRGREWACRAEFENRISSGASKAYLSGLVLGCAGDAGVTQECMFSDDAQDAISRAQGVETSILSRREQLQQKILELARQDDALAQAIVAWYDASRQYETARNKRRDE
jgi:hypothetical protein